MAVVYGVTGTPGTGKKSVAPLVSRSLGVDAVSVEALARSHGALRRVADGGVVDVSRLSAKLAESPPAKCVVYGHLLPYSVPAPLVVRAVVLRTEPSVLKERLIRRGYPRGKVIENVEAELIGVVSADAFGAYGPKKTAELDTTRASPGGAADSALATLRGEAPPRGRVDWTADYDSGAKLRSLLSMD